MMLNEKAVRDVLSKIEAMNEDWNITLTPEQAKEHSYGRVRTKNDTVKLWAVGKTTGQLLKCFVIAIQAKTILELGCSAGYSTLWLALGAANTQGHVHTTEIFDQKIALAKKHFQEAGVEKLISLHQGEIADTLASWQYGQIDLVFMDADIPNYVHYLDYLLPLLSKHAMIITDNADTHEDYFKPFYEKVKKSNLFMIDKLSVDQGLYVLIKKDNPMCCQAL